MNNRADIDFFRDPLTGKFGEEAFKVKLPDILESHEENINRLGAQYTFDTIADAQAYTGFTEEQRIELLGYYSKNDGAGHGRVYSLTDDGSGVVCGIGFLNYIVKNGIANLKHLGAKGNGLEYDTQAILKSLIFNNIEGNTGDIYYITQQIKFEKDKLIFNGNNCVFKVTDKNLLKPIIIGKNVSSGTPNGMKISNFTVDRVSYDGSTENQGITYLESNSCKFENLHSRFSKYNQVFDTSLAGCVYNQFLQCDAVGGMINYYFKSTVDGWVNENIFLGGRGFVTSDTTHNLKMIGHADHNKFLGLSLEGNAIAISCDCENNYFEFPRTEGAIKDIVFETNSGFNYVISNRYDFNVEDLSTGKTNSWNSYFGSKFLGGQNGDVVIESYRKGSSLDIPNMKIVENYSESGNSYALELLLARYNDTSYAFKTVRKSDNLVTSYLTSTGKMFVTQQFKTGQSSWVFSPIILGAYTLWIDSTGRLRIKNGTPTSENDGVVVGTQS